MPWAPRTDTGPSERCYVGTDSQGRVFGYAQEYVNGTAAFWLKPMERAILSISLREAQHSVARRALPLSVVRVDEEGGAHIKQVVRQCGWKFL